MKVFLLTAFALTAFAFNSILCRLALRGDEADGAGFTVVRLASGAVMLGILFLLNRRRKADTLPTGRVSAFGSWLSAFFLFAYAICFSFAYLGLTTATGALVLFGSVQFTMVGVSLAKGVRPRPIEWIGLTVAFGGLVYLVLPGLSAPPLMNALLMAAAGIAWGFYSLRGKGSEDPLAETSGNFVRSMPMIAAVALVFLSDLHLSTRGVILAVLSGAVASGIGYSVWYAALKHHTPTRAAVLQLSVPVIAAVGGVVFLAEAASTRVFVAGTLILGGIGLTMIRRRNT
ncbi:MAG: DMT family transporter [Pyrinomonadaceae bacterium]|nr:DMT family transporter [Pyrinomonadaceae bacterium]